MKSALDVLADKLAGELPPLPSESEIDEIVQAEGQVLDRETQRRLIGMIVERKESDRRNMGPDGMRFVWGDVVKIHYIGEHYALVEFIPHRPGNPKPGWVARTSYSCYLKEGGNFRSLLRSSESFEYALLTCVARRYEQNPNSQAADYFSRMIGMP